MTAQQPDVSVDHDVDALVREIVRRDRVSPGFAHAVAVALISRTGPAEALAILRASAPAAPTDDVVRAMIG